jgi:hypothetical protein
LYHNKAHRRARCFQFNTAAPSLSKAGFILGAHLATFSHPHDDVLNL